jgi:hypothetical protein
MKVDVQVTLKDEAENVEEFTIGSALKAVSEVFGVRKDDLLSPRRAKYITTPRFALMYLGYYMTHNSTTTVGRFLDRDHTTIIHGCRRAIELKRSNKAFAKKLEEATELAIKYDGQRRKKIEAFKREIEERMERACQSVALEGQLSGDEVIFNSLNAQ